MRRKWKALVLTVVLLHPGLANAGPIWDWLFEPCPPPCYCQARYWAPNMARVYDCVCGPHTCVFPPDRHPEIPPSMTLIKYPCPPVCPSATLIPVPTPPASSRFEYFERRQDGAADRESNEKKEQR